MAPESEMSGSLDMITMKLGEWSFEVRADGKDLYFYAAHESEVAPVEVQGAPLCEPMEWAVCLTVDEDWLP